VFHHIKKILILSILIVSGFAASCGGGSNGNTDGPANVVAKVGSKEIKLEEVDRAIKQNLDQSQGATMTAAELANARLAVLENLIQEEAVFQRAQKENLVPDDGKVNQELQKRKTDAGLTEDQYQAQLKQAGLTEDQYKDKIRHELAYTALQDKQKARVALPTDEEVKKYFEDHREGFKVRRGADISIIVTAPQNAGGAVAAEQKIKAIYEQLKSGTTDFATLAAQRSEDASNVRGGAVGFLAEEQLKQSFGDDVASKIMGMSPGQYTEPKNIQGRWVIFKVNNKYEKEENLTLDNPDVRKSIVDNLTQQRQSVLLNSIVSLALAESNVKNYMIERLVDDPKRISDMKPSALLQQALQQQPQQVQPQSRVEPSNSNTSAGNANASTPKANSNARPATGNTNR
jgi:peptidyl-prolyl cis-trans isomerase SurA